MTKVELRNGFPSPHEFAAFREACGWGVVTVEIARRALEGSLLGVVAEDAQGLAGFGRVVGDGALNLYLQDVIVRPDLRGRGLGGRIVRDLTARASAQLGPGGTLGLMAAEGASELYARAGYRTRPAPGYGPGMTLFVKE